MTILQVFLLSIAIGLIVHLLARWSVRDKSRSEESGSQKLDKSTQEPLLGSALGEVERELRQSLSVDDDDDPNHCAETGSAACASCSGACSISPRRSDRKPRIVYYDDDELDLLAHRSIESYTTEELAMLRAVAETLLEADYDGWLQSLSMRGILLPPEILQIVTPRDELDDDI